MNSWHTWRRGLLLAALATWLVPQLAAASTVGVYFDPRGEESKGEFAAFQEFHFYIVAHDLPDVLGFEFEVRVPSKITVTDRRAHGPAPLDVGSGSDNFIVGTGGCVTDSPAVLVTYTAMLLSDSDGAAVVLGGAEPSDMDGPAYLTCSGDHSEFDNVLGASINSETRSWGRLKNSYGQ